MNHNSLQGLRLTKSALKASQATKYKTACSGIGCETDTCLILFGFAFATEQDSVNQEHLKHAMLLYNFYFIFG